MKIRYNWCKLYSFIHSIYRNRLQQHVVISSLCAQFLSKGSNDQAGRSILTFNWSSVHGFRLCKMAHNTTTIVKLDILWTRFSLRISLDQSCFLSAVRLHSSLVCFHLFIFPPVQLCTLSKWTILWSLWLYHWTPQPLINLRCAECTRVRVIWLPSLKCPKWFSGKEAGAIQHCIWPHLLTCNYLPTLY